MEKIRLQKFISDSGLMSRRAAEEEIKNGDVNQNEKGNSSFEGDEFIEAALARGFDDI